MCDKEELTDATMKALQGKLTKDISIRDKDKEQMKRIIESYADTDNLDEFGKMFVAVTTNEELMEILKSIIEQYYRDLRNL